MRARAWSSPGQPQARNTYSVTRDRIGPSQLRLYLNERPLCFSAASAVASAAKRQVNGRLCCRRPAYQLPSPTLHVCGDHRCLVSITEVALLEHVWPVSCPSRPQQGRPAERSFFLGARLVPTHLGSRAQETCHASQNDMKLSDETIATGEQGEPFPSAWYFSSSAGSTASREK